MISSIWLVFVSKDEIYEVAFIPGELSTWRDIKVWDDYIYIGTEADDGIKIVSVDDPDNPQLVYTINDFTNSHNINFDEGKIEAHDKGSKIFFSSGIRLKISKSTSELKDD